MIKLEISKLPPSVNVIWRHKNNPNKKKPPIVYKTEEGKIFEKMAKFELKKQYEGKVLTEPIILNVRLFFKDKRRRDIDNYNKGIYDAMTGVIYKDDSQIIKSTTEKIIGCGFEKVEIEVEEIE